jgi:hypothetical protein
MDSTIVWVVGLLALVLAVIVAGWAFKQKRRSEELQERFGPEYDRTLNELGDRRQAESELEAREKRVEGLSIRAIPDKDRDHFREAWIAAQARFVDEPSAAITEAEELVSAVMIALGYPMSDFDQRVADISVSHPNVVDNYRAARAIAEANKQGQASTEDLRQAMVRYRALFAELLEEDVEQEVRR